MTKSINASPQDENNDRLRELRAQFNLTRFELQQITCHSHSAIDGWLAPASVSWSRRMPIQTLRLLEFELGVRPLNHDYHKIRSRARLAA